MNAQQLMNWWQGLPPWGHPLAIADLAGTLLAGWFSLRRGLRMWEQGREARPLPRLKLWQAALIFAALYFLEENNETAAAILTWPARTFPYYAAHGGALWLGVVNGGYCGVKLGHLLMPVALRLRAMRAGRRNDMPFDFAGGAMPPGGYWPMQETPSGREDDYRQ